MFKLLKNQKITTFVKVRSTKLSKQGTSVGVTIPYRILKELGVEKGDVVDLHHDGEGKLLIDLKPKE